MLKNICWFFLRTWGGQGPIVFAFFAVLVRCPKNIFFWSAKNPLHIWGAQGSIYRSRAAASGAFWAKRVPGAASRARTSGEKNDRVAEEQLVQDLTRHGPMAWRIFQQLDARFNQRFPLALWPAFGGAKTSI